MLQRFHNLPPLFSFSTSPHQIFFDNQSTSPVDFRVLDAMLPYMTSLYQNSGSNYISGQRVKKEIEKARNSIKLTLNGSKEDYVVWTSGATEADNLAIIGLVMNRENEKKNGKIEKKHIITTQIEHKAILNPCKFLETKGYEVTYLPVQKNGIIDLNLLKNSIKKNTLMLSIMHVNNEIGVIQPIKEIGAICNEADIVFHTDAAQSFGKVPIDVIEQNIDLLSISSHKIYGPKGIGALFVKNTPKFNLSPIFLGGGQEKGYRSGTLSQLLCIGFGKAAEIARNEMSRDHAHLQKLYNYALKYLQDHLTNIHLNGDQYQRYPGNLNISFEYVEGEGLILNVNNFALSSGSACTSTSLEPSYVLTALKLQSEHVHTSMRIGFSRFTTEQEVTKFVKDVVAAVTKLRELSPLWEMHQEGVDISKINWKEYQ